MIKDHTYPKRTSARSPRFKREAFEKAFEKLCRTDFEGERAVATPAGILHRPSRRALRDMARAAAKKQAAAQRKVERPPAPKAEESRILRPSIALPQLKIG